MIRITNGFLIALFFASVPAYPQAVDVYRFDPVHTQILFFASHLGFSNSQGEFLEFSGQFTFDERDFSKTRVTLMIDVESLDMDDEAWNRELKGKKFFDARRYPNIQFVSTRVEPLKEKTAKVYGNLTIRDVTRPIVVNMRFNRAAMHPLTGKYVAGFSGDTTLRRSEFGMTSALKWVGDEVNIRLEVEGILEQKLDAPQQ